MSSAVLSSPIGILDDGDMSSPRAGGPSRRRSFAPAQKLRHLEDYEAACQEGDGGAYLRREGLYSSQAECGGTRSRSVGCIAHCQA